jgi:hypothetical protein
MKTTVKRGDVILCKSAFDESENLVINVDKFGGGKIIDMNGIEYLIRDLKNKYKSFHVMR